MIGVFDSGFGGLTIHKALVAALPEQDFIYLGDNKNAPYGAREPLDVLTLTCAAMERLFAGGATLVVVACNTASVVALRWMQQQWLPGRIRKDGVKRNIIGVVVPTIEAATGMAWDARLPGAALSSQRRTIGIFATQRTVESNVYPVEIGKRRADIRVVQQACPGLVDAIERGGETQSLIAGFVAAFREKLEGADIVSGAQSARPDSIILGCTHYPLVQEEFAHELKKTFAAEPRDIPLISQPEATAKALTSYLKKHPEYAEQGSGKRLFLSTGYAAEALPLIEKFWGSKIAFSNL